MQVALDPGGINPAAAHNVKERDQLAGSSAFLAAFLRIISEHVEPGENAGIAFP